MSSCKDKENVKQMVAQNLYNTLINESKETNQNVQPNSVGKNCKILNEICTQNKFEYAKYTVLRIKTYLEDSKYLEICFINDFKRIGIANAIKTAKDFAAINSILRAWAHNEGYCVTSDNACRRSEPRQSRSVGETKPRQSRDEAEARSVLRALSRVS